MNMDTIWTSEFAAAGWLQADSPAPSRQQALSNVLPIVAQGSQYKGKVLRSPAQHQRPVAVVPQGSRQDAAQDVGRR